MVASRAVTLMKRLLHTIQTATGATKGEVTIALLLVIGAVVGNIVGRLPMMSTGIVPDVTTADIRSLIKEQATAAHNIDEQVSGTSSNVTRSMRKPISLGDQRAAGDQHTKNALRPIADARSNASINLNSASKTRLMTIPGVGEATAERILQHRSRSPFARPEDIMLVKGIGQKRFEKMRPYITAP